MTSALLLSLCFFGSELRAQMVSAPRKDVPAIQAAITDNDLEAVKKLVNKDNIDEQIQLPGYQDTPLSLAAVLGRYEIVKFLVEELKADIYRTYRSGTLSSYIPGEAVVRGGINDPDHQKTAAYLLPRYSFYKEYLKKISSASPYAAADTAWPRKSVRVFFLGERHGIKDFPGEVARLVESLPATYLATEFLNQSEQPLIDDYEAGKVSEADFAARSSHADRIPALAAAKKKGVKIIGLEKIPVYEKEEAMRHDLTEERNKNWLAVILDILKRDPQAKILVYCGQAHSNYLMKSKPISTMAASELGNQAVYVGELAGGSDRFDNGPVSYDLPTYMADKAGRSADAFAFFSSGGSPALRRAMAADVIIHLGRESVLSPK